MVTLIIAEKNSVAADIALAIGLLKQSGGYYANGNTFCIGAVGHLCQLLPKENEKKWGKISDLPYIVEEWDSYVNDTTKDKFDMIKHLIANKSVDCIVNACDAGREGELIFKLIIQALRVKKPIKRAWLQSMTEQGIIDAFDNLRDDDKDMEASARCRAVSDFLVGVNGSRALTMLKQHLNGGNELFQLGRVRTPTLALVYDRELAISQFKPEKFYRSIANFISNKISVGFEAELIQAEPWQGQSLEIANSLAESCNNQLNTAIISAVDEKKSSSRNPPFLYDLTSLQRKMNRQYGLSAADTLATVQSLYEKHKILSYPRTDSKKLPEDYANKCIELFSALKNSTYLNTKLLSKFEELSDNAESVITIPKKRVFDDKGITDHHAIIPISAKSVSSERLTVKELQVYEAVCLVFCQAFFHPAIIDKTTRIITLVNQSSFKAIGKVITNEGWLSVAGDTDIDDKDKENDDVTLPPLDGVSSIAFHSLKTIESTTKPPQFFTEDTLLGAMENAGRYVDSDELADALSDRGLGTPATRASIIESLLSDKSPNGSIKMPDLIRENKRLRITKKGVSIIQDLKSFGSDMICSPDMTGEWELKLRLIEKGQLSEQTFMGEIKQYCFDLVKPFQNKALHSEKFLLPSIQGTCPACKKDNCIRPSRFNYACDCQNFSVSNNIASRSISQSEIEQLLKTGKTVILNGFVSKTTTKKFNAGLELVFKENKFGVNFYFENNSEPIYFCKNCGKGLALRQGKKGATSYKFWGCTGYKEGCKTAYDDVKGKPKFI